MVKQVECTRKMSESGNDTILLLLPVSSQRLSGSASLVNYLSEVCGVGMTQL